MKWLDTSETYRFSTRRFLCSVLLCHPINFELHFRQAALDSSHSNIHRCSEAWSSLDKVIQSRISCLPVDTGDGKENTDSDVLEDPCCRVFLACFAAEFKLTGKSVATNIQHEFTKLFDCVLNARDY